MSGNLNAIVDGQNLGFIFIFKMTLDKMWVSFCQRLTAPRQSCVISEWGVRTNCITLTYQMIGFFFREKIAFFQKIDASEESCQTKITHFSNTLDEWSFPGQSSHRDFVIKSNCVILCTA